MRDSRKKALKDSTTVYYWSIRLLPKSVRDDVFKLFYFTKLVNDCVNLEPTDAVVFEHIEKRWKSVRADLSRRKVATPLDDSAAEHALAYIAYIVHRYRCDAAWVDAYLVAMRLDLQKRQFRGYKDTMSYMYGSAETISLILAKDYEPARRVLIIGSCSGKSHAVYSYDFRYVGGL